MSLQNKNGHNGYRIDYKQVQMVIMILKETRHLGVHGSDFFEGDKTPTSTRLRWKHVNYPKYVGCEILDNESSSL